MKLFLFLWDKISDSHTVSICVLCGFSFIVAIAYLAFIPKVYFGSTIYEAYHNHVERVPVYNMVTNDAQTEMIVANREHAEYKPEFEALLFSLERHKDRQVDYLDDHGNFKSDRHRSIWNAQGKNIDKKMDELKEKMKDNKESYHSALMVAQGQK